MTLCHVGLFVQQDSIIFTIPEFATFFESNTSKDIGEGRHYVVGFFSCAESFISFYLAPELKTN